MRRQGILNQDGSLDVALLEITDDDRHRVSECIETFSTSSEHDVDSLTEKLQRDFIASQVQSGTLEQLSKWCHSGGAMTSAIDPARGVSAALFGLVTPRLVDRFDKRVSDYDSLVADLFRRLVQ